MNEFKRALTDVAGDMSTSEKAVKQHIIHKQPRRKKKTAPFYLVSVAGAAMLLFLFLEWVPQIIDVQQAAQPTNQDLFELFTALDAVEWQADSETNRASGYYEMVKAIGISKYAQSIGVNITEEDWQQARNKVENLWGAKKLPDILAAANLTKNQFDENLAPLLIDQAAYSQKLEEKWFRDFPKMVPAIATFYTGEMGMTYMETHYAVQLEQFKEQQNIVQNESGSLGTSGTVLAVEDNMFLLVQNMTLKEYEQLESPVFTDKFAAWFMNDLHTPVKVGDYVQLKETGISVQRIEAEKVGVGLHSGIDVLLPGERLHEIKEIALTGQTVPQFYEHFEKGERMNEEGIDLGIPPLYTVNVDGNFYTVWQNEKEQLYILPFGEKEFAVFTKYTSNKLLALFQGI